MERKAAFFMKLVGLLEDHTDIMVVDNDHVTSLQIQHIRIALRGRATLLFGKNTMIRKCLRGLIPRNPKLERLLTLVRGNVGFVFCKAPLNEIRDVINDNRIGAPARAGTVAPNDVVVPPGPTGLEPTMTSFFQALQIPTKIQKGQIEIVSPVHLIQQGKKVGASESTLLQKLGITPFTYGLELVAVYQDGIVFSVDMLELTDDAIAAKFTAGVREVAAFCIGSNYPTIASVPFYLANGYANLLAMCVETDYTFPEAEPIKKYLEDPTAFAVAAAPVETKAEEAPKVEEEEEEDEDEDGMLGDMFG